MKLHFHRTRAASGGAALLLAGGGLALAANGDTVKVKAPGSAKVGSQVKFTATVHTAAANRVLAEFINTGTKCKRTYKSELGTPFGNKRKTVAFKQKGSYTVRGTIKDTFTGRHYICLYLINSKASGKTLARASHKYNVT